MFVSRRSIIIAVCLVLAVVSAALGAGYAAWLRSAGDHDKLVVARTIAAREVAHANSVNDSLNVVRLRADSLSIVSEKLVASVNKAEFEAKNAWSQFEEITSMVVGEDELGCESACIAAARKSHAADSVVIVGLHSALDAEQEANARLRLGLDQAGTALSDLMAATKKLDGAAVKAARRPGLFSHILPHLGVAVVAGIDIHGKQRIVAGPSLGWEF